MTGKRRREVNADNSSGTTQKEGPASLMRPGRWNQSGTLGPKNAQLKEVNTHQQTHCLECQEPKPVSILESMSI